MPSTFEIASQIRRDQAAQWAAARADNRHDAVTRAAKESLTNKPRSVVVISAFVPGGFWSRLLELRRTR
jgi:hypothetical protein